MIEKKIYIVEDEVVTSELIQSMLRKQKYHFAGSSTTGEQAIKDLKQHPVDLVLMDIFLEGKLNGIETAEYIYGKLGIPVVYITAHADNKTLHNAIKTNPFGYEVKPVDETRLYATIEVALHKRKLEIQLFHINNILNVLKSSSKYLLTEKDEAIMMKQVLNNLVHPDIYKAAWIIMLDKNKQIRTSYEQGFGAKSDLLKKQVASGNLTYCMIHAMHSDASKLINVDEEHCKDCPIKEEYCKNGVLVRRLAYKNDVYGVIYVSLWPGTEAGLEERNLFEELSNNIAFAIYRNLLEHEKERINRNLMAITQTDLAILKSNKVDQLINDVCKIVVETGKYHFVWIGFVNYENEQWPIEPVAWHGLGKDYMNKLRLRIASKENYKGPAYLAIMQGKSQIIDNIAKSKHFAPWRNNALKHGYKSAMVIPLIAGNVRIGILFIYSDQLNHFDKEEAKLLKQLAGNMSFGIQNLRIRDEKEKAERGLISSEKRLKLATEVTNIGIWDWDLALDRITYSNQWVKMLGYKMDDISIDTSFWQNHLHPDDRETALKNLELHLSGKTPIYLQEYRMKTKSGDWIWIRDRGKVIDRDANNKPLRAIGIHQDITLWKEQEQKIRQLYIAVEQSPASVVITNSYAEIEYVNPYFSKTTGYSFEEVIGKNPRILKSGKQDRIFYKKMWDIISTGGTWHGEFCNKKKSGETYWESASITPIKNKKGEITHYLAIKTDITDKKLAAKLLEQTAQQLTTAQHIAKIGNWVWDLKSGNITWSEEMYEIYNVSPSDFKPDIESLNEKIIAEDRKTLQKSIDEIFNEKSAFEIEYRITAKPGAIKYLAAIAKAIYDKNGKPVAIQGTVQDISNRKILENALQKQIEFENVIAKLSIQLINLPEHHFGEALQLAISQLGAHSGFDRCYIYLIEPDQNTLSYNYEWVRKGIRKSHYQNTQLPVEDFKWLFNKLKKNTILKISRVGALPKKAKKLKDYLIKQDIKSIAAIPLIYNEKFLGFVGLDAVNEKKILSTDLEDLIILAVQSITNTIIRIRNEQSMRQMNTRLKELSEKLERAREEERKAIALTLHDELGQMLTAIKLDIFWYIQYFNTHKTDEAVDKKIKSTLEIVNNTLQTARRISHELRPTVLDNFGLEAALDWLISNFTKRSHIEINLDFVFDEKYMIAESRVTIYRIVQEALTNILKHAEATKVEVNVYSKGAYLKLEIIDNGKGIEQAEIKNSSGLGIFSIKERLTHWDGTFKITGEKGKGTKLLISIPLENIKTEN